MRSWKHQEPLQHLLKLGRAQARDGIPTLRGGEPVRAAPGVRPGRDVVEYPREQVRVQLCPNPTSASLVLIQLTIYAQTHRRVDPPNRPLPNCDARIVDGGDHRSEDGR